MLIEKRTLLVFLFLILTITIAITGCNSKENSLVGVWKSTEETKNEDQIWDFSQDKLIINIPDRIYEGDYTLHKDKITMKLKDKTNDKRNGYGIYKIEGNELTIKVNEQGEEIYPKDFNEEVGYDLIYLVKEK